MNTFILLFGIPHLNGSVRLHWKNKKYFNDPQIYIHRYFNKSASNLKWKNIISKSHPRRIDSTLWKRNYFGNKAGYNFHPHKKHSYIFLQRGVKMPKISTPSLSFDPKQLHITQDILPGGFETFPMW